MKKILYMGMIAAVCLAVLGGAVAQSLDINLDLTEREYTKLSDKAVNSNKAVQDEAVSIIKNELNKERHIELSRTVTRKIDTLSNDQLEDLVKILDSMLANESCTCTKVKEILK